MKESKLLEDIINSKIELIDAIAGEVNESFQALALKHKSVSEKSLEVSETELFDTEEFYEYQVAVFRDELLKTEGNAVLKDVLSLIKACELVEIEFSEELKEKIKEKEYLKEETPSRIFVLDNKTKTLREREEGAYEKALQDFLENVKEEVDAIRRNTNTN